MEEKEFYDQALREVTELAVDVIEQCVDFANRNDYEKEWVIDRFKEQFSIAKRDFLKSTNHQPSKDCAECTQKQFLACGDMELDKVRPCGYKPNK